MTHTTTTDIDIQTYMHTFGTNIDASTPSQHDRIVDELRYIDKESRDKVIDAFAEKLKAECTNDTKVDAILCTNGIWGYAHACGILGTYIDKIADALKHEI